MRLASFTTKEIKNKKSIKMMKFILIKQNKKHLKENFKSIRTNELILPSRSTISTSEFKVPPGYLKLSGPKVSLILKVQML